VRGAILAGPSRVAVATRRRLAPILNERADITWGGAAFCFLLLVLWGGTHALRTWWGILLLGGLIALGIVALRRQTLREYPEPTPKPVGDGTPSVGARAAAAMRPKPEADAAQTQAAELARLAALHDSGALTDDEFARAKSLALS
jgi:hypothetical protein